jgi:hypothetical protein
MITKHANTTKQFALYYQIGWKTMVTLVNKAIKPLMDSFPKILKEPKGLHPM